MEKTWEKILGFGGHFVSEYDGQRGSGENNNMNN